MQWQEPRSHIPSTVPVITQRMRALYLVVERLPRSKATVRCGSNSEIHDLTHPVRSNRNLYRYVVASGDFTNDAKAFATGRSIVLLPARSVLELAQSTADAHRSPLELTPPACPKCSSAMVLRKAKRGKNAGATFWGCSTYPAFSGIRKAD